MSTRADSVVRVMGRVNHVILFIEKIILIVLMIGMLVFGFLQVFSRFILRAPIGWSEELLTYSFTWASFIGASMAIYTNSHFSVDLLTRKFSPKLAKAVSILMWILICVFSLFILVMGWRLALANGIQWMNILPLTMFWAYLSMPVCGAFIFIHGVEKLTEVILNIKAPQEEEE